MFRNLTAVARMRSEVHVLAPPEAVFDFVDDWRNAARYLRRLVRWEPVDLGRTSEVGAVYHVGIQAGPTRLDGRIEVTEYVRPQRISIRSKEGPGVTGGWRFSPDGAGTRVVLEAAYDLPGGIAGRLVGSFVARNGQRDLDASLRELKRLVESGPT